LCDLLHGIMTCTISHFSVPYVHSLLSRMKI